MKEFQFIESSALVAAINRDDNGVEEELKKLHSVELDAFYQSIVFLQLHIKRELVDRIKYKRGDHNETV